MIPQTDPNAEITTPGPGREHRAEGAEDFFSPDEIHRAESYRKKRLVFHVNRLILKITFLIFIVFSGAGLFLERLSDRLTRGRYFSKLFVLTGGILVCYWLISFPLDLQRFRLDRSVDLTPLAFSEWIWILGKSRVVFLLLFLAIIGVVYRCILWNQRKWWIPAGVVISLAVFMIMFLAPVIIDPLFARFQPLDNPEIEKRINRLLNQEQRIERPVILVTDSHRRTARANAYFTGLGKTRRVVLYDTLLDYFPAGEVESVLAHELGHFRAHHTWKGGLIVSLGVFFLVFLLSRVLLRARTIPRLGITNTWDAAGIPVLLLATVAALVLTLPLRNCISRHFEREADRFALSLTKNPQDFITAQRRLALRNLSDPFPHPLVAALLSSHPPAGERIRMALEWEQKEIDGGPGN